MTRRINWIITILLTTLSFQQMSAGTPIQDDASNKKTAAYAEAERLYNRISFTGSKRTLNKSVFVKAYFGYLNLKEKGKLGKNQNILTVLDFSLSANTYRMWVIDVEQKKLVTNSLVAHGQGTGEEFAVKFSNKHESHQSSLGFYVTANTYIGNNGYSLKLHGMDAGYNNNAFSRAIVIHGADYVSEKFIKNNQRLGRSWGCPALPQATARKIINQIKNGSCLFIYAEDSRYLTTSKWLKNVPSIQLDAPRATPKTMIAKTEKPTVTEENHPSPQNKALKFIKIEDHKKKSQTKDFLKADQRL